MREEILNYSVDGLVCHGYIVYDDTKSAVRPGVLVAHAWRGQDTFAKNKARQLAELGFVALAVDYYGNGKTADDSAQALSLMKPLFLDRALLQRRMQKALSALTSHPLVQKDQIGAIGFCFGGLAVIELFRSASPVTKTVSFHAVLGSELQGEKARTVPCAKNIPGQLLVLHGQSDPLVTADDIRALQQELVEARVDWQMHIYGNTMHAFTVPEANDPNSGLMYNPTAEKRSWQAMRSFFAESF